MQLRNRKVNSLAKHQLKVLHLNKEYFKNENDSNYCSYIDPKITGCNDLYDSDSSINLQIFLKNIFLGVMLFSIYATIFTHSLQKDINFTVNNSSISKFELSLIKPDYNKNNLERLKIVSMVFSTNNIKTKYIMSKNIKNIYKSLVKLEGENHDLSKVYPKWIYFLNKYTNTSMFKLDEYFWMKNNSVINTYSLLNYSSNNPYNFVSININRNQTINYNNSFYPYLIVL
jgi:hypothetical protein